MTLRITPNKTMAIRRIGPLLLQATANTPISDPEWDAYCDLVISDTESNGLAPVAIQYAIGHGPSAAQRKRAASRTQESFPCFALVSGSALVRGAVTAISWMMRSKAELRAFAPGSEREALTWLAAHTAFDVPAAFGELSNIVVAVGYPRV